MPERLPVPTKPYGLVWPRTVQALQNMTDGVLLNAGFSIDQVASFPVAFFTFTLPRHLRRGYDLNVYSIGSGVSGFNTSSSRPDADLSRRWTVYIDRGTHFGAAFDDKGTVYEASHKLDFGPDQQNIDTGSIDTLVGDYYSRSNKDVGFRIPQFDKDGPRDWVSMAHEGSAPIGPMPGGEPQSSALLSFVMRKLS